MFNYSISSSFNSMNNTETGESLVLHVSKVIHLYFLSYVNPVLILFGLVSNIAVIRVLVRFRSHLQIKKNSKSFLFYMALSDILVLLVFHLIVYLGMRIFSSIFSIFEFSAIHQMSFNIKTYTDYRHVVVAKFY